MRAAERITGHGWQGGSAGPWRHWVLGRARLCEAPTCSLAVSLCAMMSHRSPSLLCCATSARV